MCERRVCFFSEEEILFQVIRLSVTMVEKSGVIFKYPRGCILFSIALFVGRMESQEQLNMIGPHTFLPQRMPEFTQPNICGIARGYYWSGPSIY